MSSLRPNVNRNPFNSNMIYRKYMQDSLNVAYTASSNGLLYSHRCASETKTETEPELWSKLPSWLFHHTAKKIFLLGYFLKVNLSAANIAYLNELRTPAVWAGSLWFTNRELKILETFSDLRSFHPDPWLIMKPQIQGPQQLHCHLFVYQNKSCKGGIARQNRFSYHESESRKQIWPMCKDC